MIICKWIFNIMGCNMPSILTESTNNLEQKKQTHRRTFIIFVMKPTWKTGFASSMCPKWPGHSVMLPDEIRAIYVIFRRWFHIGTAVTYPYDSIFSYDMLTWHSTCTCLTSSSPFYDPLSWIHKATKLWTSSFCCFGVFDSPFSNWHPFLGRIMSCV